MLTCKILTSILRPSTLSPSIANAHLSGITRISANERRTGVPDESCCGPLLFGADYCSHRRSFLLFADAVRISFGGAIAAKQSPAASTLSPANS
jgi:hypothetical protein